MSVGSLLRSSYLLYFSQPAADRALFKMVKGKPIRSIVELGVSLGGRTERLLEVASWQTECLPLRYAGIDLFDSRPAGQPPLSLKQAFHELRATGATVRMIPGDPHAALSRMANALTGTDLLIVSARQDSDSLARAWKYVPRMIHPLTLVLMQGGNGSGEKDDWRQLSLGDVERFAMQAGKALRRAA